MLSFFVDMMGKFMNFTFKAAAGNSISELARLFTKIIVF